MRIAGDFGTGCRLLPTSVRHSLGMENVMGPPWKIIWRWSHVKLGLGCLTRVLRPPDGLIEVKESRSRLRGRRGLRLILASTSPWMWLWHGCSFRIIMD